MPLFALNLCGMSDALRERLSGGELYAEIHPGLYADLIDVACAANDHLEAVDDDGTYPEVQALETRLRASLDRLAGSMVP